MDRGLPSCNRSITLSQSARIAPSSWVKSSGGESDAYATAFATLTLSVPDGRLSIFNRDRPVLEEKEDSR